MHILKPLSVAVLLVILLLFPEGCMQELLVECESFDNRGGWVVDPQFVEQMGSPYLMAHGMGEPVENATTTIELAAGKKYHVWARTMDWAPGHWDSPGRFNILIDGKQLPETVGKAMGWGWHYAGKIKVENKTALLELKDLSGFNARCDAVYICSKYRAPTNQQRYLDDFRRHLSGAPDLPEQTMEFDLVVVGGGIAGCAASIAAAEQGLNVALIHDRPVLGGNASSEIRVHTLGIYGHFERILKMLDTEHYPNSSPGSINDEEKRHHSMALYPNVDLFLEYRAFNAASNNLTISSVDAKHIRTGKKIRFTAPLFVDCTGDGWIGYWAGADYMYGREKAGDYHEGWDEYGELWSPDSSDNKVLGASLLWRSFESDSASTFPKVPWAMEVAGNHAASRGTWQWEMISENWHQIENAEHIRDHMLKAIFGSFYNEKKKPGTENLKLEWVPYILGKRESRRLIGDYIYSFNDMRESRSFPDSVVVEERAVDMHFPQDLEDESKPDFLTEAIYYQVNRYYVPYRSLYSKDINNLFMAGRCFSSTHIGLGGPRVMKTTGQMGAAVGYAASLCKKYECSPRDIFKIHLEEYMQLVLNSND